MLEFKKLKDCLSDTTLKELSDLDRDTYEKYQTSFSDEIWGLPAFKYQLPDKFRISLVAFFYKEVVGYCIASKKKDCFYIHRFVVKHPKIQNDIAKLMLDEFESNCNLDIYLSVNAINKSAINLYQSNGFKIIDSYEQLFPHIYPNKDFFAIKDSNNPLFKYGMKKEI